MLGIAAFFAMWRKLKSIENNQKPKFKHQDYNKFIEHDSIVMDDLDRIRQKYNADRAIVFELRNGEVNVANIPSMKVHIRNEQLKPNVHSVSSAINGVPASFYSRILRQLVKNEVYSLPDVSDIKDTDYGLYQNLIYAKVKSLYAIPLFDYSNALYGCLMIESCDKHFNFSEQDIERIEIDASRLNGEIMSMKKVEESHS